PETQIRTGRSVEIDDLYKVVLPGDPQASPDGTRLVAPVLTIDRESDEYRTTLWDIPLDGGAPTPLTSGQWTDASPRWSPDGKWIAFTSNRKDKKPQIHLLPVAGGEARRITDCENGVGEIAWAPDSDHIAFTSTVAPEKDDDSDVKVITSARYKFDAKGFLGDKVSHIFTVHTSHPDAEPVQITKGHFNHGAPAWSPDGRQIAFVANRDAAWDMSRTNDVWIVNAGGGEPRKLTDSKGRWNGPVWSPDGATIAVLGNANVKKAEVNTWLYIIPAEGGKPSRVAKKLNRTIGDSSMSGPNGAPGVPFRWLPDGSGIDALVSDRGSTVVMRFRLNGKRPIQLTGRGRHITAFDRISDDDLVIAVTDPTTPAELHRVTKDEESSLTSFNTAWLEGVGIPAPEEFWVESNGEAIQGWLIRPAGNTSESTPVPLILNIHGGPHAQFSNSWFHELQLFVARGNALVYINPRGSTGRTDAFGRAVKAAWGVADMPDFMAAVDHVLSLGGLDANRLGVTGGSYGGFSTNWLLGHTDRFRAAVTDRSICNMVSMAGTDDISIPSLHPELGLPWETTELYWNLSPLKYAGNVQTPCLIIHSEEDHRCPMEQAEQWFIALKVLGVPTEFVRFPNESHGLGRNGKPKHRVERLERTLEWFEKYL
ncbi:MAG TPA: S9 family peptidase, partial [Thermomicrobiales bacterium]|nr:S9 family peptidase [Thermomicrobiales bacterium]